MEAHLLYMCNKKGFLVGSGSCIFITLVILNCAKPMKHCLSLFFFLIFGAIYSQQTDYVDFKRITADLQFPENDQISGAVEVRFRMLQSVDSVYLDAVNMDFEDLALQEFSGNEELGAEYRVTSDKLVLQHEFQKNTDYILQFSYSARPKKALYFVDDQIWTQGQGKYTSNWLPSIDDMNDKIVFEISITYADDYQVVANGNLDQKERLSDNQLKWHYKMTAPMSSYLVALAIGHYEKKTETSRSGILLENYYYPKDSARVEPTYRYSKRIFDFLEEEIGWPYPWGVYRQVPVQEFLYSGMENTTLTIFSDALVVDDIGFNDRNYVNVNAHELAHQWFGDLVTETSGTHHWLQEGFATYYALLAEKDVFGADYFYWQLFEYAQQLLEQENNGQSTSLLNPKSSSITFYQKGCWALHVLREQVGESVFKAAIKKYLQKYQFKNVETMDFISEVEKESGTDLSEFVSVWLKNSQLPQDAMVRSLKNSDFIQEFLEVNCDTFPEKCSDYLVSDISDKAKIKVLSQEAYKVKLEDFNNHWEVRQAIAEKLTVIPVELKSAYESLLKDPSYTTMETALYNLWVNFPQDRSKYLYWTKDLYGFSDYNIKLLWLALHLNTVEYQPEKKEEILKELRAYSDPNYSVDVRANALKYLKLIGGFDHRSIANLIDARRHHDWRFRDFSKRLLEDLREDPLLKEMVEDVMGK